MCLPTGKAFAACLAEARRQGAERFVLLGDTGGYGGDPEWVVHTVMAMAGEGAADADGPS